MKMWQKSRDKVSEVGVSLVNSGNQKKTQSGWSTWVCGGWVGVRLQVKQAQSMEVGFYSRSNGKALKALRRK